MLIKCNKGSNCIPTLRNTINDEHLDEMVYDDEKNYLYQRKPKVINRATSSTVCEVSAGVPQGSVLGSLLF